MKVFLLIAAMALATSAFAETAPVTPPLPSAPASKAGKTDFTKPFIYDGLRRQLPPNPQDHPTVELNAGPGPINR
jgi:hypothetical protein